MGESAGSSPVGDGQARVPGALEPNGHAPDGGGPAGQGTTGGADRPPLSALILDNLSIWAFVALAIAFLYCVWATLVILVHWTGPLPGVSP